MTNRLHKFNSNFVLMVSLPQFNGGNARQGVQSFKARA